jgi:hypothetical protein
MHVHADRRGKAPGALELPTRFDICCARHQHQLMRTTLDIEGPVLEELRAIQKREGGSLGALVSRLLAEALAREDRRAKKPFRWTARPMRARVDLADKDAPNAILD